ncbi:MAG: hypothetical protein ACREF4_21000, partial [Gammaproteobacteria bacterium]
MTRNDRARLPALMLTSALACTGGADRLRTDAPVPPAEVTVTATDFAFGAPDTIESGLTTFRLRNHGDELHMAQLIRLEDGRTLDEFLVAYAEAFRTAGPRPPWATRLGGPGAADPRGQSNATHQLEPGNYAWICLMNVPDGIPHVVKARMARPFVVRPRSTGSAAQIAPDAGVVIRLADYAFHLDAPLTAGRHVVRVVNEGSEPHEVALVRLVAGKTMREFEDWMQAPDGPPPINAVGGVSSIAAGAGAWFEVDL